MVDSTSERERRRARERWLRTCLACGSEINEGLRYGGSLRCADCRTVNRRLDATLVAAWERSGGRF
jgi:hypothetical protein